MKKLATSLIFFAALSQTAYADEETRKAESAVGLSVGWVEANGLSYRRYFQDSYIQFTFAGSYDKAAKQEYFDGSISGARYLTTIESSKFFPVALKFVYGLELERDTDRSNDLVEVDNFQPTNEVHLGAGLGFDIGRPQQKGLGFSANATYTASFESFTEMNFVRLGLLPSASVYYNF